MNLMEFFRISNMISFKEGEIRLMEQNVNVTPTAILCDFQKGLIENIGFAKAYETLYGTTKKVSFEYNSNFIKKHGFKSSQDTSLWQLKLLTVAGWGIWNTKTFEIEKNYAILQVKESPFSKTYGPATFPVDIIVSGLIAGGASAGFKTEVECIETKCQAMGDPVCEFEIGPTAIIAPHKKALWKKWKII